MPTTLAISDVTVQRSMMGWFPVAGIISIGGSRQGSKLYSRHSYGAAEAGMPELQSMQSAGR